MTFLVQLLVSFVLMVVAAMLTPKQKRSDATVQSLKDDDFPLAEEGTEIPVVFGEVILAAPTCVWYGDIKTREIRSGGGGKK